MSLEEHSIPVKKPVLVSSLACTSVSTKYFTTANVIFIGRKGSLYYSTKAYCSTKAVQ